MGLVGILLLRKGGERESKHDERQYDYQPLFHVPLNIDFDGYNDILGDIINLSIFQNRFTPRG